MKEYRFPVKKTVIIQGHIDVTASSYKEAAKLADKMYFKNHTITFSKFKDVFTEIDLFEGYEKLIPIKNKEICERR